MVCKTQCSRQHIITNYNRESCIQLKITKTFRDKKMWDGEQGGGGTRGWGNRGMPGQRAEGREGRKGGLREGVMERQRTEKRRFIPYSTVILHF